MTGFMSPKVNTEASKKAASLAAEEEAKAKIAEQQTTADAEYRRTKQLGRASTVLTVPGDTQMRSMLGG